jgi:glyoxalase family protein
MSTDTSAVSAEDYAGPDYAAIAGLHHVTSITATASENVAFYTQALGLRLVKKTVNQDDVSAYHLFYADGAGRAGTDVTFFDWRWAAPDRRGAGTVDAIALRAPGTSIDWWEARFERLGIPHDQYLERDGRAVLPFTDLEGQRLELVADEGARLEPGQPWSAAPVPTDMGLRGLFGVTITSAELAPTAVFLTEVLGFRQRGEEPSPNEDTERVVLFESGPGGPGAEVRVRVPRQAVVGSPGRGGVHHVAFRVASIDRQKAWRDRIVASGTEVTPLIDRFYFSSIYFREPGGVLFEIATDGPGFASDEPLEHLGESLALPPFLEPRRAAIEAGLIPIQPLPGRFA